MRPFDTSNVLLSGGGRRMGFQPVGLETCWSKGPHFRPASGLGRRPPWSGSTSGRDVLCARPKQPGWAGPSNTGLVVLGRLVGRVSQTFEHGLFQEHPASEGRAKTVLMKGPSRFPTWQAEAILKHCG